MRLAMAKPMPRAPPVTMALRFFRSMAFIISLSAVIASEAKQSSVALRLDCFVAEPVIGPATSGRTRWLLAMTIKMPRLKLHPVGALEAELLPRFVRRGDLIAQILDDAADLGDLLGIAFGELAWADIERVLEPDAHIAAEHRGRGAEIHLVPPTGQDRPQIILAEQPVGGALHKEQIVEIRADAAENAEEELQEHRRLEQAVVDAMGEIVQVSGIVAFMLELDAVALAERPVDLFDVAKRVGKNVGVGIF